MRIDENEMTSELTPHSATRDAVEKNWWWVTWLPKGQVCDRNQAITAVTLAEFVAQIEHDGGHHLDHHLWPHVCGFAGELNLTGLAALALLATPQS